MPLNIILMDDDKAAAAAAAAASAPPPPHPGQVLLQRRRSTWIGWKREGGPAAPAPSVSGARGEARRGRTSNAQRHTHARTHTHPPTLICDSRLKGAAVKEGSRRDLSLCVSVGTCAYFSLLRDAECQAAAGNGGAPLRRNASGF